RGADAELGEDLAVVLAEERRAAGDPPGRLLEAVRSTGVADAAADLGVLDPGREAARAEVLGLERLLPRVHDAHGHATALRSEEEVSRGDARGDQVHALASGPEDRGDLVVDADLAQVDALLLGPETEEHGFGELGLETELDDPV